MKDKRGYTLTELLVVIVIIGVIAGLSIPVITNVQNSLQSTKYDKYLNSVVAASKLYTESYSKDLFGHNENGCAYVSYNQLEEKNLIKDIQIDNTSCNTENTFVKILKIKNKYVYTGFLGCKTKNKNNNTWNNPSIFLPNDGIIHTMDPTSCTGSEENNLAINADLTAAVSNAKRKKTKITITSSTGIENKIIIYGAWRPNTNYNEVPASEWQKIDFKVKGNQEQSILNGNTISTTSNEILTPEGATGTYYLILRVDYLRDLYGNEWKNPNPELTKYLYFGPFGDLKCPTVTATSNGSPYTKNTWTNKQIDFTFDFSGTNAKEYDWYVDNGSGGYRLLNTYSINDNTRNISDNGKRKIKVKVKNNGYAVECPYDGWWIDKTPPSVSAWKNTSIKYTNVSSKFISAETKIYGVGSDSFGELSKLQYYTTCNNNTTSGTNSASNPKEAPIEEGIATIKMDACKKAYLFYRTVDKAGNTSNWESTKDLGAYLIYGQLYSYYLYYDQPASNNDENLSKWVNSTGTVKDTLITIVSSNASRNVCYNLSPQDVVRRGYRSIVGRWPDVDEPEKYRDWVTRISTGLMTTRVQVLNEMVNSEEAKQIRTNWGYE